MTETMPTSEVLNRAADLIEERGWERGEGWVLPGSPTGSPLCLEGGIQAAMGLAVMHPDSDGIEGRLYDTLRTCPAYQAVQAYLEAPHIALFHWNDRAARNASEVVEVLRACAVVEASCEREAAEVVS